MSDTKNSGSEAHSTTEDNEAQQSGASTLELRLIKRIREHQKSDPTDPVLHACKLARIDELRRVLKDLKP